MKNSFIKSTIIVLFTTLLFIGCNQDNNGPNEEETTIPIATSKLIAPPAVPPLQKMEDE